MRPNPRQKYVDREWLGDVVAGAGVEPDDDVDLGVAGRDQHDGQIAMLFAEPTTQCETIDIRQAGVEQDKIRNDVVDGCRRVGAVGTPLDDVVMGLE